MENNNNKIRSRRGLSNRQKSTSERATPHTSRYQHNTEKESSMTIAGSMLLDLRPHMLSVRSEKRRNRLPDPFNSRRADDGQRQPLQRRPRSQMQRHQFRRDCRGQLHLVEPSVCVRVTHVNLPFTAADAPVCALRSPFNFNIFAFPPPSSSSSFSSI